MQADDTHVLAEWPDGCKSMIRLTKNQLKGSHTAPGVLYENEHTQTHHKISIKQRVDRSLLMSVYEQNRQILQVKMNLFGPIDNENVQQPLDHPATQGALSLLTGKPLVDKYCAGELTQQQLKDTRAEALKDLK